MALRRAPALDACDDRTHGGRWPIRRPWLHADAIGDRLRPFSPLRNALSDHTEGAVERHLPACRAIVATRLMSPELEHAALRALQFAQFTTTGTLDDPDTLRSALASVDGLDASAVVRRIDDPQVVAVYEADRARARTAAGSPTEFQGKAANTDGAVRYTAPSLVFDGPDGQQLEAGGFQPIEACDVVIANLDPTLARRPPAEDPVAVLNDFPYPLTTAGGSRDDRAPGRPRPAGRRARSSAPPVSDVWIGGLWATARCGDRSQLVSASHR